MKIDRWTPAAPLLAAEPSPAGKPPAPEKPKPNRFDALFVALLFSTPAASTKTYGDDDRKSKKLVNILVEIANPLTKEGSGLFIRAALKAVQSGKDAKIKPEFVWHGTQYQSAVQLEDESAKAEMAAWKDAAMRRASTWFKDHKNAVQDDTNSVDLGIDSL